VDLRHSIGRKTTSGRARRGGPHISLERRLHRRRPAVDYRVWVGGWIPKGTFTTIAARLDDISRGGARVVSTLPFAEGDDVWLRPASPAFTGCVRAQVLQCSPTADGQHVARLRFRDDCPDLFFQVITGGSVD
jgi:hypothetical protein